LACARKRIIGHRLVSAEVQRDGSASMPRYDHLRLRPARESCGLTQQQVADQINRTVATYSRYEQGSVVPTVHALGSIAGVLGVPIDDLFDPDDPADAVAAFQAELTAMIERVPPLTAAQKSQLRVLLRNTA
jgi:transcriptional regulator with XRE-family HTH domain